MCIRQFFDRKRRQYFFAVVCLSTGREYALCLSFEEASGLLS